MQLLPFSAGRFELHNLRKEADLPERARVSHSAEVVALWVGKAALAAENLPLRHQIPVLQRSVKHPKLRKRDRIFWSWLSRIWKGWRSALVIAPRAPLQNPYAERVIGSIRRECLDHLIVLKERHLRAILSEHVAYYHEAPARLSLDRNSPIPRQVEPPGSGRVVAEPFLGGLHHRYRRAA
jgi:hypothetical protein